MAGGHVVRTDVDHKLNCLARHICRMDSKEARRSFFAMMGEHHPPQFIADLQQRVQAEWEIMHSKPMPAPTGSDQTGARHGDA